MEALGVKDLLLMEEGPWDQWEKPSIADPELDT